ncbi:MAG: glycosyltransferase [Anaerolineae bacterium]|nr:glycosyltransferase [Anaerolineae bacterium]
MTPFVIAGFMNPRDGYGYGTLKIIEAIRAMKVPVQVLDLGEAMLSGLGEPLQHWQVDAPVLAICTPDWIPFIETGSHPLAIHTMFEATRLPEGWVEKLNTYADQVIVPCVWNQMVFKGNGVTAPLDVARWGIDPGDYWPLERSREKGRPYTFLWSGTPDGRKGWDVAYRAFRLAFGDDEGAHLTLHFRQLPSGLQGVKDGNVEMAVGLFPRWRLREMLRDADCYVFPSRGEGWGLPPREAAATGLPVLATDFGGLAEELEYWGLSIPVRGTSPAQYGIWDDIGDWVEPNMDELAAKMRFCYEHRDTARVFGRDAALWLAQCATWKRTAREMLYILREVF